MPNKATTSLKNPVTTLGMGCGVVCLTQFLPITFLMLGLGQVYTGEYRKAFAFLGLRHTWDMS